MPKIRDSNTSVYLPRTSRSSWRQARGHVEVVNGAQTGKAGDLQARIDAAKEVPTRREITDLRNTNVLYAQQSLHNAVEQTASDVRASRLLQIKQESSMMRDCPPEPRVWWDNRKPKRAA